MKPAKKGPAASRPSSPAPGRASRRDRDVREFEHDTYKGKGKLAEPSACPQCGAVFHKGRWTWGTKPAGAHDALCPACQRIEDKYPKGIVTLKGSYAERHKEELLGLIHNEESKEKSAHPLARIMSIANTREGTVISTTDSHLPKRIGDALHHAYHGELDVQYNKAEDFVRVTWSRKSEA